MSDETVSITLVQMISQGIVQRQMFLAAFALLIYASLLHLKDEVRYIWMPKFSLATFLYLSSKYAFFFILAIEVYQDLGPGNSLSLCNDMGFFLNTMVILGFTGVQGLITIRTYALCQGYRPMTIATFTTFFTGFILRIYVATVPACDPQPSSLTLVDLIYNIAIILSDALAFLAVTRQVWGLWKEKRRLRLQNNADVVTLLLQQGVLRFSFALFITIAGSLTNYFSPLTVGPNITAFQNVLSLLLICEFTLALRGRNAERSVPRQSAVELPNFNLSFQNNPVQSIQSVLGRLHDNILADMGETTDQVGVDSGQEELEYDQETT